VISIAAQHHYFLTILALVGFIISAFYIVNRLSTAIGFLLSIFFIFLFLESYIGGVKAEANEKMSSSFKSVGYKVAPLSSSYMATSIIGFLVSFLYIYPTFSEPWGLAFGIVFIFMFIASIISMTNAPLAGQLETEVHMDALKIRKK